MRSHAQTELSRWRRGGGEEEEDDEEEEEEEEGVASRLPLETGFTPIPNVNLRAHGLWGLV